MESVTASFLLRIASDASGIAPRKLECCASAGGGMPAAFFRVESSIVTEASERTDGRIDHVASAAMSQSAVFPVSLPDKAGSATSGV